MKAMYDGIDAESILHSNRMQTITNTASAGVLAHLSGSTDKSSASNARRLTGIHVAPLKSGSLDSAGSRGSRDTRDTRK
eukprot:8001601-Prorocentrum_lima.AAC.1